MFYVVSSRQYQIVENHENTRIYVQFYLCQSMRINFQQNGTITVSDGDFAINHFIDIPTYSCSLKNGTGKII